MIDSRQSVPGVVLESRKKAEWLPLGTSDSGRPPAGRPLSFVRLATQFENAGDCLINRELVRLLSERGDLCLDVGRCPADFARQVAAGTAGGLLHSVRRGFYIQMLLARLRGRRCLWFLTPGAVSGGCKASGRLSRWVRDLPLLWASMLGVRICQIGVSFGGMSADHLSVWRRRRKYLSVLSPRDTISVEYLERCGLRCDGCVPDLAFNLFVRDGASGEGPAGLQGTAGFSFRTDQYPGQAEEVAGLARAICHAAGREMRWIPVVQVARDLPGMETLRATLHGCGVSVAPVLECHHDLEYCFRIYRGVSPVVSNRLHVLLMAASQGSRILAVAGGPTGSKIEGVFRDLGMSEALVDPRFLERIRARDLAGYAVEGRAQRARLARAFDTLCSGAGVAGRRTGLYVDAESAECADPSGRR
jgi:hypothetical protein